MEISSFLLIIILSFFLFFATKKNKILFLTLLSLFLIRIILSIYFFYLSDNSLVINSDEEYFFDRALLIKQGLYFYTYGEIRIGTPFFIYILSRLILILGEWQLSLQFLFSFLFILFLLICHKMLVDIFNQSNTKAILVILMIGLYPSFLYHSLFFTREVPSLLLLALAVYFLSIFIRKEKIIYIILAFISIMLLATFDHKFTLISPIILVELIAFFLIYSKNNFIQKLTFFSLSFLILFLFFFFAGNTGHIKKISELGAETYLNDKRDEEIEKTSNSVQAFYDVNIDTTTPINVLTSSLKAFYYYLVTPFPWQVRNITDIIAFLLVTIEIYFYYRSFKVFSQFKDRDKTLIMLLFILAMTIALIHAIGTINWGTAFRHKIMHTWIFFILGSLKLNKGKNN